MARRNIFREMEQTALRARAAQNGTLEHYDRSMAQMEQDRLDRRTERRMEQETRQSQQAEEAAYQQTKAVVEALDSGMTVEQVEAAVQGRPDPTTPGLKRCDYCGRPSRHLMTASIGAHAPIATTEPVSK